MCSRITVEGIFVYDSAHSGRTSESFDIQLAQLHAKDEFELKINVVPIQQQRGVADCGVFAAAICLAVVSGQDPANIRWRQANMRTHLKKCISSSSLTPFPTIQQPKITSQIPSSFMIKIWCICRLPEYAFAHMVECEKCDMWFHKPCTGLPDDDSKLVEFSCPICGEKNHSSISK